MQALTVQTCPRRIGMMSVFPQVKGANNLKGLCIFGGVPHKAHHFITLLAEHIALGNLL